MAWGSSSGGGSTPAPSRSTLSQLLPLIIILLVLGGAAWVGYQIYLSVGAIRDSASQRMGRKNVVFTKDGVRVGVKHVQNEKYVDKTQSLLVKAWNLGNSREDESLKSKKKT